MEILVFGHTDPDTDSIASALGYAWFAQQRAAGDAYLPCRLGEPNTETGGASILEHGFCAVPVLDGRRIAGIVSQRELARC